MLGLDLATVVQLGHKHLARFDFGDAGVGNPFDVVVAKLAFQHGFGVAHAAQPHVADIRLAGHIGQGHLVAQFSALQILVENERKLISRAEARSARHGTNDGRSRVFQEFLIGRPGLFGVVHGANRLRVALRACTGYFIE